MNFIKRYISIIIPAAIFIVGIGMLVLTFFSNTSLNDEVKKSVSMWKQVSSLASQTPSAEQYKVEAAYQKMHEEDATTIENMFLQSTMRELISYKIFPKPKDTSRQIFTEYSTKYRNAIELMVQNVGGVDAPSDKEIEALNAASKTRISRGKKSDEDPILEALCRNKAAANPVYMNPRIFPWYDFWYDYYFVSENIAVQDCWNSQVALWVYQDVVDSIKMANGDAKSVFASPVKRLLAVSFMNRADQVSYGVSTGSKKVKTNITDQPHYITEDSAPILIASSFTGRKGDNETLDVIHFSVSVVVAVDKIPDFVSALSSIKMHKFAGWDGQQTPQTFSRNQITILDWSSIPVVKDEAAHKLYRYGDQAVVQWTATCEYIFARQAYADIMPDVIKDIIKGSKKDN